VGQFSVGDNRVYHAGADGGPGTYHVSDATLARYNAPYQPMLDAGFQQVNRNYIVI
jgi:hypothetical protein